MRVNTKPALEKEKWFETVGVIEAPPPARPAPLPTEDDWALDVSDEDLQATDPDAQVRRIQWRADVTAYNDAVRKVLNDRFIGEFQSIYSDLPHTHRNEILTRYSAKVQQSPELVATHDSDATLWMTCAEEVFEQTGYEPEQDVDELIRERQAHRAKCLAPAPVRAEEKE
jgi:hypothetical protein